MGTNATLILSIRSNLLEAAKAQIWFRLPRGIISRSPDRFEQVYFPHHATDQQYSVSLHADKPGNYPLQASIYTTLAGGQTIIHHFYTYLLVTPTHSRTGSEPFDGPMVNPLLETKTRLRVLRANLGEVTVRGTIVYFDDNDQVELPINRPQVVLYLETATDKDFEIASTFADERGEYIFANLTNPELNNGKPRDLHVVVNFENSVLSITDSRRKLYELRSETVRNVPDGQTIIDLSLNALDPNRGVGHIFNTIQLAHAFLLNQLGWERDRPVQVIWPGTGRGSYYLPRQFGGQVSRETISIAYGEDQWRRITMFHEYGHAVMTAGYGYNFNAVPWGHYQGTHRLETVSDPGFAFNEGWAEFMEAAVDNRALNVIGNLNQEAEVPNIESNSWWTGHVDGRGANISGEKVEGTVASILWDIFDAENSIDHQPGVDDDGIANRFNLLWEIFTNDAPQSITDIAIAWRNRGFPMLEELDQIYATHHALSRPNTPPTFRFTSPAVDEVLVADRSFRVTWEANDPDGDDFIVDLFYDLDLYPGRSTQIESGISSDQSQFNWDTNRVAEGKYYLRAVVTDSRNAKTDVYNESLVIVDHSPLLPPIITSETHPDLNRWYVNNSLQLDLLTQPNQIDSRQYSFILDHQPETVLDTIPDVLVRNNKLALAGLGDGAWWVHVRARDELGYWTGVSHFAIKIDSTAPPTVTNLRWATDSTTNRMESESLHHQLDSSEITLEWDAIEDTSGITAYHIQIDVDSRDFQSGLLFNDTVDGNATRYTLSGEPNTTYYARIKVENGANALSRNWSTITQGIMIREVQTGDVNQDGVVDLFDLVQVANHFGETFVEAVDPNPDVNQDGVVDISDLLLVAAHFGESVNTAPILRQLANQLIIQYATRDTRYVPYSVTKTKLLPNYPNPFNPETWIPYELAVPADVKIEIYVVDGRLVRRLDLGRQQAGHYHQQSRAAYWDGRDGLGAPVASGVYFYVLHAGARAYMRKMEISK